MKLRTLPASLRLSLPAVIFAWDLSCADTILFPVVAVNQPNVTTIVSVISTPGVSSSHLTYIYRSKESLVGGSPNHTGTCVTSSFVRPSFDGDLVSFDASGVFNSGNALFNDGNSYPGGFALGLTGPRRAYLLVTNSNGSGSRVNVGENQALGGEAMVMDIAFGAAWGMRGLNDKDREDYSFTLDGVGSAIKGFGKDCKRFAFFPSAEWEARFFVTPIGNRMNDTDLDGSMTLWGGNGKGVYTRDGVFQSSSVSTDLKCTAAVDLDDMIDSTVLASIEQTGGWSWLCPVDGLDRDSANPIVVYKLEFVVENSTYGGTNNSGILLSTDDDHW